MLLDYCLNKWEDVKNDIDMNNPTQLDKILLLSKEWESLNINNFQCFGKPCKYLNKLFELKGEEYNYYYGVQSVDICGVNYNFSPRIPRVRIDYKKGGNITYVVVIGDKTLPKNTKEYLYRFATENEIEEIIHYMEQMIADRKEEIEQQSKNPSLEEILNIFKEYVNSYLNNKFTCDICYGKSLADASNNYALLIRDENHFEIGHITISMSKYKEIGGEVVKPICGRYYYVLKDWKNEYKTKLSNACNFIIS